MNKNAKARLLRIKEASEKYKIPESEIRELVTVGRLTHYDLDDDGGIDLVDRAEIAAIAAARHIKREMFQHLDGMPIGISEAALKYSFHVGTISQWVKEGHIREIGPDPHHKQRRLVNEADVAYAAALRDIKGIHPGRDLWD